MRSELNIPVELIWQAFNTKGMKPPHLRTFLFLKTHYSDRFILYKEFFKDFSKTCAFSEKTCRKHFKLLVRQNWIGHDKSKKMVYLRSWKALYRKPRFIPYYLHVPIQNLESNFNELALAGIIAYAAEVCIRKKQKPELKKGGSLQGLVAKRKTLPGYAPLSLHHLALLINRSVSSVDAWKKKALKLGFISREKDFQDTRWKFNDIKNFIQAHPELAGRLRLISDKLCLVAIDLLKSNLLLKKEKTGSNKKGIYRG